MSNIALKEDCLILLKYAWVFPTYLEEQLLGNTDLMIPIALEGDLQQPVSLILIIIL